MTLEDQYQSRGQYAAFVQHCLERMLGITLHEGFRSQFLGHAKRVHGFLDYEDFGALLLVECQEKKHQGHSLSGDEIAQIMDAIRHRIARQTSRHSNLGDRIPEQTVHDNPPDVAAVKDIVAQLDASDLVILNLALEGNVESAAAAAGKSVATVYRRLKVIRELLKSGST